MRQKKTLQQRMVGRIDQARGDVFLTREFADMGGEDQIIRALRELVRTGRLVRLGYGVYGRAVISRRTGEPILYSASGFAGVSRQALTRLGVKWEPTRAERAYNEGVSTQIPINPAVHIKERFSRRLSYRGLELEIER